MTTYPHTIDNEAGERLTFLRRVADPEGERIEVENLVKPGGPPMHVHHYQEEALTVVEGADRLRAPGAAAPVRRAGRDRGLPAGGRSPVLERRRRLP